jgi:hypothetical protein
MSPRRLWPQDQRSRFLGPHRSILRLQGSVIVRLSEQQVVVLVLCRTETVCQRETIRRCNVIYMVTARIKSRILPRCNTPKRNPSLTTCYPESRWRALVRLSGEGPAPLLWKFLKLPLISKLTAERTDGITTETANKIVYRANV